VSREQVCDEAGKLKSVTASKATVMQADHMKHEGRLAVMVLVVGGATGFFEAFEGLFVATHRCILAFHWPLSLINHQLTNSARIKQPIVGCLIDAPEILSQECHAQPQSKGYIGRIGVATPHTPACFVPLQ
jgi:hypothetical protein